MRDGTEDSWGLVACGVAKGIDIDLCRKETPMERWNCQISRPGGIDLYFDVSGPEALREFSNFVEQTKGTTTGGHRLIGRGQSCEVFVVKDDEFEDRFFLSVRDGGMRFRVTFVGEETVALSEALKSLVSDLDE